jgi:hypothetical protein
MSEVYFSNKRAVKEKLVLDALVILGWESINGAVKKVVNNIEYKLYAKNELFVMEHEDKNRGIDFLSEFNSSPKDVKELAEKLNSAPNL